MKPEKKTVADVMREIKRHAADGWRISCKADFNIAEYTVLAEDLRKLSVLSRAFYTEEIRSLSRAALSACSEQFRRAMCHIRIWSRIIASNEGKGQLDRLAIRLLADESHEPPAEQDIAEMTEMIKSVKNAFDSYEMIGDAASQNVANYVADKMNEAADMLDLLAAWLRLLVGHAAKRKRERKRDHSA